MVVHISTILFFAIPAAVFIFFIISLIRYCLAKKRNKQVPGTYSESQIQSRRMILIASSFVAGMLVIAVIIVMALMFMALAFM